MLSLEWAQVPSLIGELRSHLPCGEAKGGKTKKVEKGLETAQLSIKWLKLSIVAIKCNTTHQYKGMDYWYMHLNMNESYAEWKKPDTNDTHCMIQTIYNDIKQTSGSLRAGTESKEDTDEVGRREEFYKQHEETFCGGWGGNGYVLMLIEVMFSWVYTCV